LKKREGKTSHQVSLRSDVFNISFERSFPRTVVVVIGGNSPVLFTVVVVRSCHRRIF